jgi:hypothetical protein
MTVYGRGVFYYFIFLSFCTAGWLAADLPELRRTESVFIYFCLWALNYISIDYMV